MNNKGQTCHEIPLSFLIIVGIILFSLATFVHYVHFLSYTTSKYEQLAEQHILYLFAGVDDIKFYGFCDDDSTLLGVLYSIKTGEPFYIIVYPSLEHATVVINNTEYTTILFKRPLFKFGIECSVPDDVRNSVFSENRIRILMKKLANNEKFVECKLKFFYPYFKKFEQKIFYGIELNDGEYTIITSKFQK